MNIPDEAIEAAAQAMAASDGRILDDSPMSLAYRALATEALTAGAPFILDAHEENIPAGADPLEFGWKSAGFIYEA